MNRATAWPLAAGAPAARPPFVNVRSLDATARDLISSFPLSETGFVEGRNVTVEYHSHIVAGRRPRRNMISMRIFGWLIAGLIACQPPGSVGGEIVRPRSVLVVSQSDVLVPYYVKLLSKLTATVNAAAGSPVSLYEEVLDLPSPDYARR
jgi:hypothetical protein